MIDDFKDEIQKLMAERYDNEFVQVMDFVQKAYSRGYREGEETAKATIIAKIKGEIL